MQRVIILSTLVLMLMAVAGVTIAQELTSAPLEVTTIPETTAIPEETTLAPEEDESENAEDTVAEKPGKDETPRTETKDDETTENEPDKPDAIDDRDETDEVDGAEEADEDDEATAKPGKGKPVGAGKSKFKKSENAGGKKAAAKPAKKSVKGGEPKAHKVTVCHKGKKTLSVGAPAEKAHVRHGDTAGACG